MAKKDEVIMGEERDPNVSRKYKDKPRGRPPVKLKRGKDEYDKQFHKTMSYYGTVREFYITPRNKKEGSKVRKVINVYARTTREYNPDPKFAIDVRKGIIAEKDRDTPGEKIWPSYTAWHPASAGRVSAQKARRRRGGRREARRRALKIGVRTEFPLRIPSISGYI